MAYIVMASIVMACMFMTYIVLAYTVMAYIVIDRASGQCSIAADVICTIVRRAWRSKYTWAAWECAAV